MKRKRETAAVNENRLTNLLFNKSEILIEKLKCDTEVLEDLDLKPAWIDEDDALFETKATSKILYKDNLKQKYEVLMGTPSWAKLNRKIKHEDDDDLLRTVGHLKKVISITLPKDFLEIKKFPKIDLVNGKQSITCLVFHPTSSVLLIGSHLGHIALFSIGSDINNQLHSFKLQKFRPSVCFFTPNGSEAYIISKQSHEYCVYNLVKAEPKMYQFPHAVKNPKVIAMSPNGKVMAVSAGFDEVFVISTASKELLRSLKHNTDVEALTFSNDSEVLYSYCKEGQVCIWSLSNYRVIKKFYDHGCVTSSCIAVSPCGRLLATGSGEGIVNVYDTTTLESSDPIPIKTIENLKTKITQINFNSTSEILSVVSSFYPNAVKLVHIPSYHVFANFPLQNINLYQVESVNFSPNGGFMAVGNNKGDAFLFRLKHYKNY